MHIYIKIPFASVDQGAGLISDFVGLGIPFATETDYSWHTVDLTQDTDNMTEKQVNEIAKANGTQAYVFQRDRAIPEHFFNN